MSGEPSREWWAEITIDLPFNTHVVHKAEDASFLVGQQARDYVTQFLELYSRASSNCIVTTIAGYPGTGKSYTLAHLTYRMQALKDIPGIPVLFRLVGKEYRPVDFVRAVRSSPAYQERAKSLGVPLESVADERGPDALKVELASIRDRDPRAVLCIFVDNVDEYVRLIGGAQERDPGIGRDAAWTNALIGLLRPLNAINDSIGAGVCIVLSLTPDVVNAVHLADVGEAAQSFIDRIGRDSSLRRRIFPMYRSPTSPDPQMFGPMSLEDATEMVARNLGLWFSRHEGLKQEERVDCMSGEWNLYPFQKSAVDLIHKASEFPGEVILGCLAAIQRYRDLRLSLADPSSASLASLPLVISESIAASGILQMNRYFGGVGEKGLKISDLVELVRNDANLLYAYVLPQEAASIRLRDGDLTAGLGESFLKFLGRLPGSRVSLVSADPVFIKTRGDMKFPRFPTFDCLFQYETKLIGVQFLSRSIIGQAEIKVETCCHAIQAEGHGGIELYDHVHTAIIVCAMRPGDKDHQSEKIVELISREGPSWAFKTIQDRDYRPRVAVAVIPEDIAWFWKALDRGTTFREVDKNTLTLLMERVDVYYWTDSGEGRVKRHETMKWLDFLQLLGRLYDIPASREMHEPPERPGFDR